LEGFRAAEILIALLDRLPAFLYQTLRARGVRWFDAPGCVGSTVIEKRVGVCRAR